MSSKRNHHRQPNFYLKGFKSSEEGNPKVWVYEKGKPFYDGKTEQLQNPKHLTTEKAARKKDFYAFEKEDGSKEYEKYEDLLMKEFEQPTDSIIERIRRFEEINDEEKKILSKYIASIITRGDWWDSIYKDSFGIAIQERFKVNNLQDKEIKELVIEEVKKSIEGEEPKYRMIETAKNLAKSFQRMKLHFLITPQFFFLTSDRPFYYTNLDEPNSYLTFPISSKITILLTYQKFMNEKKWKRESENYWEVDYETVKECRWLICSKAIKEVYYSQKAEWLVKFINNRNNN